MKKFSIILSAFAIIVFLAACNQTKQDGNTTSNTSNASGNDVMGGFAYVNTDTLLTYYEYYDELKKEFDTKKTNAQKQLLNRRGVLQDEVISAQKRAQAGLLSVNEQKKLEEDLGAKQQQVMQYEQDVTEGLMAEEKKMNEELYKKVTTYIKEEFNKDKKIKIVMGITEGGGMFYVDPSMDITKAVLEGLNKKYQDEKAKK